jgi:hypothetical protein
MALFQIQGRANLAARFQSVIGACCLVTVILCSPASTAGQVEKLSVSDVKGEYYLRIAAVLNAPADYVYKVITDYKHAYRINPTITEVEILPSGREGVVRVKNHSEQCVGPFCFDVVWAGDIVTTGDGDLEVETVPELSDFVSGYAVWRIRPQGGHTQIIYESRLKPAFFIPPLIGDLILKKHIKDDTLITFRRIECQAMIRLALDMAEQPEHLRQLSKEGRECDNPFG